MGLDLLFWILMLLWLVFTLWYHYPWTPAVGSWLFVFVLLLILGWAEFGTPVKGNSGGRHAAALTDPMPVYVAEFPRLR